MQLFFILTFVLGISPIFGRPGFQGTEQEWGYVTVRPQAHIFWWLFFTNATENYYERPLIIWLQGGPGGSGTGIGNFEELGPFDQTLQPRNTSWVNYANVLFVDSPVGTGFSYVDDSSALASTNQQVADDFLVLMQAFYKQLPDFQRVPLYIFCESYGGKMTAQIALTLDEAVKNGSLKANLTAVGLGDSWVAPYEIVAGWPEYLFNVGQIDGLQLKGEQNYVATLKTLIDSGKWNEATDQWSLMENRIMIDTDGIDFYNILSKIESDEQLRNRNLTILEKIYRPILKEFYVTSTIMNKYVKAALNLTSNWQELSDDVFNGLYSDFMKPAVNVVKRLLEDTNINVVIYNGQLDLVCATPGVIKYVENLNWTSSTAWINSERVSFAVDGFIEGFAKSHDNFTFYWVNRAGHMVPSDNPSAMRYILEKTTNNFLV